jgi:hypothetical protein
MTHKWLSVGVLVAGVMAVGLAGVAQQGPTEAPAGFATPTLAQNPGSQSISNGIAQPPGDTYALDQTRFEQNHDASTGLGPVFNARACADCHQNPVSGGSSQFTEIRAGHNDANGNFVAATVPINDGANSIANRSIINDRALIPQAQEHIPDAENVRALRAALNTFGDGFVEAIDDSTFRLLLSTRSKSVEAEYMAKPSKFPFWNRRDNRVSAVLAGRISTAACSRSSATLI